MKLVWFSLCFASLPLVSHSAAADWRSRHIVRHCDILSLDGTLIKRFPGRYCLFLDDGRFISGGDHGLKMYDKNQSVVWSIPGHFHHQLNWSDQRKSFLALSSEFVQQGEKNIRQDVFLKIDLKGKILHRQNLSVIGEERSPMPTYWTANVAGGIESKWELSHFNSIHEIPENSRYPGDPIFKPGNIIVNEVGANAYILTPDLSKVLLRILFKKSKLTHDAQVTKRGTILLFSNESLPPSEGGPYSSVDEVDPKTGKLLFRFTGSPLQLFYSKNCGGVQELDSKTILISHQKSIYHMIDRFTKKVVYSVSQYDSDDAKPLTTQDYRSLDLSRFLKAWNMPETPTKQ